DDPSAPDVERGRAAAGDREPREGVLETDEEARVQAHDPVSRVRGRARADLADDRLPRTGPGDRRALIDLEVADGVSRCGRLAAADASSVSIDTEGVRIRAQDDRRS